MNRFSSNNQLRIDRRGGEGEGKVSSRGEMGYYGHWDVTSAVAAAACVLFKEGNIIQKQRTKSPNFYPYHVFLKILQLLVQSQIILCKDAHEIYMQTIQMQDLTS